MSRNMISVKQSDSYLKELAIANTAKYVWTSSEINLAKLSSMQIFLKTWQEHLVGSSIIPHNFSHNRSFNFPAQFASKITRYFFFLHPTRKPTNLEVRYLIQVAESLIVTNLHIDILRAVQETNLKFLMSYQSKNVFVFSSFYCSMICFTAMC